MRVLGLGIASIADPVYGGQRRLAAFRDQFAKRGIPFRYIGVLGPAREASITERGDFVAGPSASPFDRIEGLKDVARGAFSAGSERLTRFLSEAVDAMEATHVYLDQCFLFPAFEHLKQHDPSLRLIYSSHNVEAPLKEATLRLRGVQAALRTQACALIEAWERAAVGEAEIVAACSPADAEVYREFGAREVMVVRAGVGDFPVGILPLEIRNQLRGHRFLLTVGSAHPPNADGFARLVLDQSHRFAGNPTLLACGGMVQDLAARLDNGLTSATDCTLVAMSRISDAELGAAKEHCHGFFLPILIGGGSNLKTAEALITGKHVVGTTMAFRGFEEFKSEPGVVIADTPGAFKDAIDHVMRSRQPTLTPEQAERRKGVHWDRSLTPFFDRLGALPA